MRDTAVFVESALMAVEKWLYERIDTKEDVSDAVNQMLTETKSAAFLGLLVSVGLYSPGLFNSPLRPLLSCPDLYTTQRSTLLGASWKFLFEITWGRYGKRVSDEVRTWNEMPHRRYELYELARRLLFFNDEAAVQLEIYRKRWQAEAASEANANGVLPTTLEVFIAQLDRDNYTVSDAGNGQVAIEFHAPKALEARLAEERKGPALNLSAMNLIAEAGRSIDEAISLTAKQAESIYQRLREIVSSDRRDGTFEFYRKESISAGVALLVVAGEQLVGRQFRSRGSFALSTFLSSRKNRRPLQTLIRPNQSRAVLICSWRKRLCILFYGIAAMIVCGLCYCAGSQAINTRLPKRS